MSKRSLPRGNLPTKFGLRHLLFILLFAVIILFFIWFVQRDTDYCTQVTKDWRENPELFKEKYGFEYYSQWRNYYMEKTDFRGCLFAPKP